MLRNLRKQNGSVIVISMLVIAVLIGFSALVVDVGMLAYTKTQLQSAANQAALAGCIDLNSANPSVINAKTTASDYAKRPPAKSTDTVYKLEILTTPDRSVEVGISRTVNFFFAQVFGFSSQSVSASATAAVFPAGAMPPGAPPFVIEAPAIIWQGGPLGNSYSQIFHMKLNPTAGLDEFTYVNVDFETNKRQSYLDTKYSQYLATGYEKSVKYHDDVYFRSVAQGGKAAVEKFATRLDGVDQDAPENIDALLNAKVGDPQLMLVPVVSKLPTDPGAHAALQVQGFVGFWFEKVHKGPLSWDNRYLDWFAEGRFVQVNLPAGAPALPGQVWFGVGSIQLIK